MFDTAHAAAASSRFAQLQRRYLKVLFMQASHPRRFDRSPRGHHCKTLIERCDDILRHLRYSMSELWEPRDVQHAYIADRLATLAEHLVRVKRFMAVSAHEIPLFGTERQIYSKVDTAFNLVFLAQQQARTGHVEDDLEEGIDDIEVVTIHDAA